MEALLEKLRLLLETNIDKTTKSSCLLSGEDLQRTAHAVEIYMNLAKLKVGLGLDFSKIVLRSELIGYIQHELEDLRATPTSSDDDTIPDDGSQDYAIGYEDGKIGGQIIAFEQLLQRFETKSAAKVEIKEED